LKHSRLLISFSASLSLLIAAGCGSSKSSTGSSAGSGSSAGTGSSAGSGSSSGGTGATCASVPGNTVFAGSNYDVGTATCATHTSGKWTALTIQEPTGSAPQGDAQCDADAPYADQATFDANEATSGASGTTITSNHDYVVKTTCASGSVQYTTSGSTEQKILFIWTKNP